MYSELTKPQWCLIAPNKKLYVQFERVSRTNSIYKEIRGRHYIPDHGTIGRQIHYLIYLQGQISGIISGASAVFSCKPRDEYFGVNKDNRKTAVQTIIDNTVFRLENNLPNLASQVLGLWRKHVVRDWQEKYKSEVIGFETFVHGKARNGHIYKADNWAYVGMTKGSHRVTTSNANNIAQLAQDFADKNFVGKVTTAGKDAQKNNIFRITDEKNKKMIYVRWLDQDKQLRVLKKLQSTNYNVDKSGVSLGAQSVVDNCDARHKTPEIKALLKPSTVAEQEKPGQSRHAAP